MMQQEPSAATDIVEKTASHTPAQKDVRAASEAVDRIHFAGLLRLLLLERRTMLQITGPLFVLLFLFIVLMPPKFTSLASIVPPSTSGGSAAALMGQISAMGAGGLMSGAIKSSGDLYAGILKSHSVTSELVRQQHLVDVYHVKKSSQAEKLLAANTDITVGLKDSIVSLAVTDTSASRARDLVAGYLDLLREKTADLALTESSQRRLFYEQRLAKEKDELAAAEVTLKATQEKTGLIAPAGQTASEIQAIAQLRASVASRQVQLASLLHEETEQNPEVIRLRKEINDLQGQVVRMSTSKFGSASTSGPSTSELPSLELAYIRATREVKYHETLFDIIAKQYEAARLDEAHDPPLQVLDQPSMPDMKSGPPRMILTVSAAVFALLCGAAFVWCRAWFKLRRKTS